MNYYGVLFNNELRIFRIINNKNVLWNDTSFKEIDGDFRKICKAWGCKVIWRVKALGMPTIC